MSARLVTKSEFANRANVSRTAITKATKAQGELSGVMIEGKVDTLNVAAVEYLRKHHAGERDKVKSIIKRDGRSKPRASVSGKKAAIVRKKRSVPDEQTPEYVPLPPVTQMEGFDDLPKDIQALGDLSLRKLCSVFGTDERFADWLKATHLMEKIDATRVKNAQEKGLLVTKTLVQQAVIDPIDTAHQQLMTDGAKTLGARIRIEVEGGATDREVEKLASELVSNFIKPVKEKIIRNLRAGLKNAAA